MAFPPAPPLPPRGMLKKKKTPPQKGPPMAKARAASPAKLVGGKGRVPLHPAYCMLALCAMLFSLAMGGCTPLQRVGSVFLGEGIIVADKAIVKDFGEKLNKAFTAGKIDKPTYDLGYDELTAADTAFTNLGTAIATGQTVTQEQVAAAEKTFLVPLATFESSHLGGAGLPPRLTATTKPTSQP